MHTCVHTYIRTYTLAYVSTYICTCVNTYIHMHLPTYIGKDDVLLGSPAGRELILGEGRANSKFALTSSLSPSCDRAAHGCSNMYVEVVIALAVPPARPIATSICMYVHTPFTPSEHTNAPYEGCCLACVTIPGGGKRMFSRMTLGRYCFCWSSGGFDIAHPL